MEEINEKKILQIIPATNWWAVYDGGKILIISHLVCWALVKEGKNVYITGMDARNGVVDFCEEKENLKGYVWAPEYASAMKEAEKIYKQGE